MTELKFVVWNMEWMNNLFIPNDERPANNKPAFRKNDKVDKRVQDLIGVLNSIEPDIVVVVEGPSSPDELELFFKKKSLQGKWKTHLQPSGSSQAIGIACRTDKEKFREPVIESFDTRTYPAFNDFEMDVDTDGVKELYKFTRRPLYVKVLPTNGKPFCVLGLHLKSKGIFNALEWSMWWRKADGNRRRILAEASQIRKKFIEPYLQNEETRNTPLLVCGDVNDGPGMDASERKFAASGIERLMGSVWKPNLILRNALFESLCKDSRKNEDFSSLSTTRFEDPIFSSTYHKVWIDHIMYSNHKQKDVPWVRGAKIHKSVEVKGEKKMIWNAFPNASDHQPVEATLTVLE